MKRKVNSYEDWLVIKLVDEYFNFDRQIMARYIGESVEYLEENLNAIDLKKVDFEYQLGMLRVLTRAIVNKNDIDSPTSKEDLPVFILGDTDGKDRLQPKIQ